MWLIKSVFQSSNEASSNLLTDYWCHPLHKRKSLHQYPYQSILTIHNIIDLFFLSVCPQPFQWHSRCRLDVVADISEQPLDAAFSEFTGYHIKKERVHFAEENIASLLWKRNGLILCDLPLRTFPKLITRSVNLQSALSPSPSLSC